MVDSPDALGDDPCTVTGLRAIDEPGRHIVRMRCIGCRIQPRGDLQEAPLEAVTHRLQPRHAHPRPYELRVDLGDRPRIAGELDTQALVSAAGVAYELAPAERRERQLDVIDTQKQQAQAAQTFTTGGFSVVELRDSVAKAIGGLPENLQAVVKLRHWEGLSCREISTRLNMPEGSVKRLLFDANNRLYDKLKAQFESTPAAQQVVPEQIKAILEGK